MPRKGRETELILKEIESLSLGDQAQIKSPDLIRDIVTGNKREVDISIKHKMGTHEFLTVIECRNRKGNEDVTWIEQIATKTKNLRANKVIAVSTAGFSNPAKKLAEHENIILRTLKDFTAVETIDWAEFIFKEEKWNLLHMDVNPKLYNPYKKRSKKIIKFENPKFNLNENIIKTPTGEYINFNNIIKSINKSNHLFEGVKDNEPPIQKNTNVNFDPKMKHLIKIDGIDYYIDNLYIKCEYWIDAKKIPPKKLLKYKEKEENLLDRLYYEFITSEGKKVSGTFIKDYETGKGFFKGNIEDFEDK